MIYRKYLLPIGLLSGTIIGAGIFALPFVFSSAGLPLGFASLVLGTGVFIALHLLYADIIIRTPGTHRFVGYAQIHLGPWPSRLALLASVPQMLLVLTIYLILAVRFGELLLPGFGTQSLYLFWIIGSALIFLGLRTLASFELWMTGGIVAIIFFLFVFAAPYIETTPVRALAPHWELWFLPFAPVLFALSGRVAIPSLVRYAREFSHSVRALCATICWGTAFPAIVYGVFVISVVALSPIVSDDAVTGLLGAVPSPMIAAFGILGLLSLLSSYIVVGLDVSNILEYDFRVPLAFRIAAVVGAPIAAYLVGLQQFIALVSFTSGIFLSLEGMLISWMWWRLPPHTESHSIVPRWGRVFALATLAVFGAAFIATLIL